MTSLTCRPVGLLPVVCQLDVENARKLGLLNTPGMGPQTDISEHTTSMLCTSINHCMSAARVREEESLTRAHNYHTSSLTASRPAAGHTQTHVVVLVGHRHQD